MSTTAILNVILALGVIVMVVTPLVWAILTQHRAHQASARQPEPQARARAPQPSYKPVIGRG